MKNKMLKVSITKKTPKPNAPRYVIETIEDMYKILTLKNYKRFLKDFGKMIRVSLLTREILDEVTKEIVKDKFPKETPAKWGVNKFVWIDD